MEEEKGGENDQRMNDCIQLFSKFFSANKEKLNNLCIAHNKIAEYEINQPKKFFSPKFFIVYELKTYNSYIGKGKVRYLPKYTKTCIGTIKKNQENKYSSINSSNLIQIHLENTKKSIVTIEQLGNKIVCTENQVEQKASRFEVIKELTICNCDIFFCGCTNFEIQNCAVDSIEISFSAKNSNFKGTKIFRQPEIVIGNAENCDIHCGDDKIMAENQLIIWNDNGIWKVTNLHAKIPVWKYFATNSTLGRKNSPNYELEYQQKIQIGKFTVWTEEI